MVDLAASGTSSSVPHSKQRTCLCSMTAFWALTAGCSASSIRKCAWHFLQIVEYALRGSGWVWPHLGHATGTVFGLAAGVARPLPATGDSSFAFAFKIRQGS